MVFFFSVRESRTGPSDESERVTVDGSWNVAGALPPFRVCFDASVPSKSVQLSSPHLAVPVRGST